MPSRGTQETTAVGKTPQELLEEFSEKWNVASDVADASVTATHDEAAVRRKHMELHADESVERNAIIPRSQYERAVKEREALDERYDSTPVGEDGTVEFVETGQSPETCGGCGGSGRRTCGTCRGSGENECPECGGSRNVRCEECRGDGTATCSKCHGDGTTSDGDGEVQCPKCGGAGEHQCSRCSGSGRHTCSECGGDGRVVCGDCSGSGDVTCSTCAGEGEVVEATRGTITFTYTTENEFETERVPARYVPDDAGEKVDSTVEVDGAEPALGGAGTYRKHVATFRVPATTVEYAHGGESYEFYAVDGDRRADSFPKSSARRFVTVASAAGLVVALLGGLYYLGYLPV